MTRVGGIARARLCTWLFCISSSSVCWKGRAQAAEEKAVTASSSGLPERHFRYACSHLRRASARYSSTSGPSARPVEHSFKRLFDGSTPPRRHHYLLIATSFIPGFSGFRGRELPQAAEVRNQKSQAVHLAFLRTVVLGGSDGLGYLIGYGTKPSSGLHPGLSIIQ